MLRHSILDRSFCIAGKNKIWGRSRGFYSLVICLALLIMPASISSAAIITSGEVDPADPASWTSSTGAYIGKTADGGLMVDAGSDILSSYGYIGGFFQFDRHRHRRWSRFDMEKQ